MKRTTRTLDPVTTLYQAVETVPTPVPVLIVAIRRTCRTPFIVASRYIPTWRPVPARDRERGAAARCDRRGRNHSRGRRRDVERLTGTRAASERHLVPTAREPAVLVRVGIVRQVDRGAGTACVGHRPLMGDIIWVGGPGRGQRWM
jgi:hypothetical protein